MKDTTRFDRVHKPTADLTYLRVIYSICILICGCFYSYTGLSSFKSTAASLIQGLQSPIKLVQAGLNANPGVWKAEKTFLYGTAFYWTLLHFADLKFVGKLSKSWPLILAVLLFSTLFAGPGAALLVMWAWREELMAKKHIGSE